MRNIGKLAVKVATTAFVIAKMAPHVKNEKDLQSTHKKLEGIARGLAKNLDPSVLAMPQKGAYHKTHRASTSRLVRGFDDAVKHATDPIARIVKQAGDEIFKGIVRNQIPKGDKDKATIGRMKKATQRASHPKGPRPSA